MMDGRFGWFMMLAMVLTGNESALSTILRDIRREGENVDSPRMQQQQQQQQQQQHDEQGSLDYCVEYCNALLSSPEDLESKSVLMNGFLTCFLTEKCRRIESDLQIVQRNLEEPSLDVDDEYDCQDVKKVDEDRPFIEDQPPEQPEVPSKRGYSDIADVCIEFYCSEKTPGTLPYLKCVSENRCLGR